MFIRWDSYVGLLVFKAVRYGRAPKNKDAKNGDDHVLKELHALAESNEDNWLPDLMKGYEKKLLDESEATKIELPVTNTVSIIRVLMLNFVQLCQNVSNITKDISVSK